MQQVFHPEDRSGDLWLAYQRAMATYRLYAHELESEAQTLAVSAALEAERDGWPGGRQALA